MMAMQISYRMAGAGSLSAALLLSGALGAQASPSDELAQLRAENTRLKAELATLKGDKAKDVPKADAAQSAEQPKKKSDKRLFIRKDHLETVYYVLPGAAPDGKGASVSYSQDYLKNAGTLTVQGFASYIVASPTSVVHYDDTKPGEPVTASLQVIQYTVAPFVYANGTINSPAKITEKNTLQVGLDNEFELYAGTLFDDQAVRLSPYFQTDFRGKGDIYGLATAWEPFKAQLGGKDLNLGSTIDNSSRLVSLYWRLIGEGNVFHVGDAGLSNWASDTTYSQLGGKVALYGILFQNMPEVGPALCGRIGFNTSYEYLWDPINNRRQHDYHAEIDYALGGAKPAYGSNSCGVALAADDVGATSVALTYDNGTDRDSNETREQLKLALTYQY